MTRSLTERRLSEVAVRLKALRAEVSMSDEQRQHFTDQAEDARLRALVSETPLAGQEYREAQKHADAMTRHLQEVRAELAKLETTQDELLDRLMTEPRIDN